MKKILFAVLSFLLCVACSENNFPEPSEKECNTSKQSLNEWVDAAEKVVILTKDKEAEEILAKMKKTSFPAMPVFEDETGEQIRALEDLPQADYNIAIIPISEEDAAKSNVWKKRYYDSGPAFFLPSAKTHGLIVLKNREKFSKIRRGIIFLHEGKHAIDHLEGKLDYLKDDNSAKIQSEYLACEFEIRLIQAIGGKPYKLLLEKVSRNLEKRIRQGTGAPIGPMYIEDLHKIFGEPISESEEKVLKDELLMAGYFKAIDKVFGVGSDEAKAWKLDMMKFFYSS